MLREHERPIVLLSRAALFAGVVLCGAAARADEAGARPIQVVNPHLLGARHVPAVRVPLGVPNDYKPFIARLRRGDLLVVAFCFGAIDGVGGYAERALFWRSQDGGRLASVYRFRGSDGMTHVEAVGWRLPVTPAVNSEQ